MRIQPLIQSAAFDVVDWDSDGEFAIFPQGARAKESVFGPNNFFDPVIVAGKRYLFKRSNKRYSEQFWGEVVAYRIGCLLGVEVPPAFGAYNSRTGHCATLIEWFYNEGKEVFSLGGDFLLKLQPDFDRKFGTKHNLISNSILLKALAQNTNLHTDWRRWWVEALLFDALIGNTDRHQDNWGLIFWRVNQEMECRLTPLFDNGTSLGYERFPADVMNWDEVRVDKYINKGNHLLRWTLAENQPEIRGHFNLLERALLEWPEIRAEVGSKLNFSKSELSDSIIDLCQLDVPVKLSADRMEFIIRLTERRLNKLKSIFNE